MDSHRPFVCSAQFFTCTQVEYVHTPRRWGHQTVFSVPGVTAVPARDAAYKLLVEHVHQVALVAVDESDDGGLVRQRHQLVYLLFEVRCFRRLKGTVA
jgi:hypothetical protein